MKLRNPLILSLLAFTGVAILVSVRSLDVPMALADDAPPDGAKKSVYEKDILPFLKKHCFSCHGNGKKKADFSFDKFKDDKSVLLDRKSWDSVLHMLHTHE